MSSMSAKDSTSVNDMENASSHSFNHNTPPAQLDPEAQKAKEKYSDANAGDGTVIFDQYMTGMPLILCFLACFSSMFLIGLDQTIVSTILSTVGQEFNSYDKIAWLTTGYMLTMSIFAQTWGRISIIFGRKYALLAGIVLFEAGSLLSALAPNMNSLIGGRVLSGIGGGGIQTLVIVVMSEVVPVNKRPLIMAMFVLMMSLSTVTGPLIGGAFAENVSWRWCFYVNLPIGGLAFFMLIFFYRPPAPKFTWAQKARMVDYVGALLLAAGLVLVLIALSMGGVEFPWKSGAIISMFIIGPLILAVFGYWNFKHSEFPIIPWVLVSVPQVIIPLLALFCAFFIFLGSMVYLSTYFEVVHHASPMSTGLHFLPMIIAMVLAAFPTGIIMRKTRLVKPFAVLGGVLGPVAMGLCTLLDVDSSSGTNIGLLILPGVTIGLLMQSSMMSCQLNAPKVAGSMILVTALTNFFRSLGGAIGGDLAQVVFNASVMKKAAAAYEKNPELFTGFTKSQVQAIASSTTNLETLSTEAKKLILKAIMSSIHNVFFMCMGIGILMFILTLFYSNKKIPKEQDIKTREEHEREQREMSEGAAAALKEAEFKDGETAITDVPGQEAGVKKEDQ